jgi:hypothetical protein
MLLEKLRRLALNTCETTAWLPVLNLAVFVSNCSARGIGGSPKDVNEAQLRKMASVVDGETRYWFIESAAELTRKFEVLALREVR